MHQHLVLVAVVAFLALVVLLELVFVFVVFLVLVVFMPLVLVVVVLFAFVVFVGLVVAVVVLVLIELVALVVVSRWFCDCNHEASKVNMYLIAALDRIETHKEHQAEVQCQ